MNAQDFCYWLRGYFEINGEEDISKEKADIISKHLTLVFQQKAKDLPVISKTSYLDSDDMSAHSVLPLCTVSC